MTVIIPLFLIGSFAFVWKFIDLAQLISYIVYINIEFTQNFKEFVKSLKDFNLNRLLPNFIKELVDKIQEYIKKNGEEKKVVDHLQIPPKRFEIQNLSSSFIINGGTIFYDAIFCSLCFIISFCIN